MCSRVKNKKKLIHLSLFLCLIGAAKTVNGKVVAIQLRMREELLPTPSVFIVIY